MGRRIGGAGGGSDKGTKAGVVAAGAVVAGLVAYSGGAVGGGAAGVGAGGSTSGLSARVVANKLDAKKIAKSGKGNAWGRVGMRAGKQVRRFASNCAAHATGDVRAFLVRTPCRGMRRLVFPVTLDGGATVAVSVVWVDFASPGQAQRFLDLHRIHGNGDIAPLSPALVGLPPVTFTALNYDARRDGAAVGIAETEAPGGGVEPDVLDAIAEVAAAFPRV